MEAHGHVSQMQLVLGSPVDTGGHYDNITNYYLPVKVQARHYRQVKVRVSTTVNVVDPGYTGYGAISISPFSHNNISDFGKVKIGLYKGHPPKSFQRFTMEQNSSAVFLASYRAS